MRVGPKLIGGRKRGCTRKGKKLAARLGTEEMVGAPDKEDKEQAGAGSGESGEKVFSFKYDQ